MLGEAMRPRPLALFKLLAAQAHLGRGVAAAAQPLLPVTGPTVLTLTADARTERTPDLIEIGAGGGS